MTLILLPGMDGTGNLFSAFIAALPKSFETITVPYQTDRPLSYLELNAIVRAACSISEPFVLLAESFSTPLAIQYAATNPTNLVGLVLCAGFATSPVTGWQRFLGSLVAPLMFRIALPKLAARVWLVGPDATPSLLEAVQGAISSVHPKVLCARLRAILECEVRPDLNRVAVPILYLQAKSDRLVGDSCLGDIRRIKPQVTVASLEGPHLILQREPQRAAEAVVQFVQSNGSFPME